MADGGSGGLDGATADRLRSAAERLREMRRHAGACGVGHRREDRPPRDDAAPAPPLTAGTWPCDAPGGADAGRPWAAVFADPDASNCGPAPGRVRLLSRFYFTGDPAGAADLFRRAFPVLGEIGDALADPAARLSWRMEVPPGIVHPYAAHWAAVAAHNVLAVPRKWCRHERGTVDLFHDLRDAAVPLESLPDGTAFILPDGRFVKAGAAACVDTGGVFGVAGRTIVAHPPMLVVPADAVPAEEPDPRPCGCWKAWEKPPTWCELPGRDALAAVAEAVDAVLADPPRLPDGYGVNRYTPAEPWPVRVDPSAPRVAADWADRLREVRGAFAALGGGGPRRALLWRLPHRWPDRWWPGQSAVPPEVVGGTELLFVGGPVRSAESPRPACSTLFGLDLDPDAPAGVGEPLDAFLDAAGDAGAVLLGLPAEGAARLWSRWGDPVRCERFCGLWLEALFAAAWGNADPRLPGAEFFTVHAGRYPIEEGHGYVPRPVGMIPVPLWRGGPGLAGRTGGEYRLPTNTADPGPYAFPTGPNGDPAVRRFGWMADPAGASATLCDWLLAGEAAGPAAGDAREPAGVGGTAAPPSQVAAVRAALRTLPPDKPAKQETVKRALKAAGEGMRAETLTDAFDRLRELGVPNVPKARKRRAS